MVVPDYNILTPDTIDRLLERPIETALGKKEIQRINNIQANYDYYNGKQAVDEFGKYIYSTDNDSWDGKDYKPTKYWTNYFKAFIKRKSRWQMAGQHGINVLAKSEDEKDIEFAKNVEAVLYRLWKDNDMDSVKMQLARERLIAGSIACKLSFNPRTGRMHWIWHKATEVFPLYSKDGFNELIGCDIIIAQEDDDDPDKVQYVRQSFRLEDETGECWFDEVLFREDLSVKRTITPKTYLGFDFIPVVTFDIKTLATESSHFEDIEDMKVITRIINDMMEDANDSLKFEMFAMTVFKNSDLSQDTDIPIAPGAILKINSGNTSHPADVETIENSFQWKETFKDQYNRLKSALHELNGIPQITPTELNFGGMNDRALQVLYQEIIQETQEQWLMWDRDFGELFLKSLLYLQHRTSNAKFRYDIETIKKVDEDLETEMNFVLPLPDDRADLVDLIIKEIDGGLESHKHGMQRLGVKAPEDKIEEIYAERKRAMQEADPYGEVNGAANPNEDAFKDVNVLEPVENEV
ncbi:phage portal protein [Macrococcus capreoli]|uniref:phage portal protein n=1 Tax=Macrococcus capreoli TaxID=2982690 RepID=UPI0021D5EC83|nr:phage portal protein [Macrococcus sp. TMW 2.2395]MCU7556542.1 phage portal protein [Macrococcus sp. TMW 2.2395]